MVKEEEGVVLHIRLEVELPPSRGVPLERLQKNGVLILQVQEEDDAEWVSLAALYTEPEDVRGLSVRDSRPKRRRVQTDGVKETVHLC